MAKEQPKHRNYCFTLNNYTGEDMDEILNDWGAKYVIFGKETGKSGTKHLQGYVEWKSPRSLLSMKKLNPRIHWEVRAGTAKQAIEYCKKEGDWMDNGGDESNQGKRSDLLRLRDEILLEGRTVQDIRMNEPEKYHKYGRTLDKLEEDRQSMLKRTWMTEGIWYFGETGVGKSHIAREGIDEDKIYTVKNFDKGWWDEYNGHEIVLFDDFRGNNIEYSFLLQLVDKWDVSVSRRGRKPIPFVAKKVIVTSALQPHEIYYNLAANDKLDQLYRRFKIFRVNEDRTIEEVGKPKEEIETTGNALDFLRK